MTEGSLLVDSAGRAWLETIVDGIKRTSYIGFVDTRRLEEIARERRWDFHRADNSNGARGPWSCVRHKASSP